VTQWPSFWTKRSEAHDGLDRWTVYNKVNATIVTGGDFFPVKALIQDPNPCRMTIWRYKERSSVLPYGAPVHQRRSLQPVERGSRSTSTGLRL
jgi:hypothetical protein